MCGQIVIVTNFRYPFSQMPKTLAAQGIRGFFKKQYETNPNGKVIWSYRVQKCTTQLYIKSYKKVIYAYSQMHESER